MLVLLELTAHCFTPKTQVASEAEILRWYKGFQLPTMDANDCFLQAKHLWMIVHDMVDRTRALTYYAPTQLRNSKELLESTLTKLRKLVEYTSKMSELLIDEIVKIDDRETEMKAAFTRETTQLRTQYRKFTSPREEDNEERPTTGKHDRASRATEGRKDTVRKPFSLADTMARNRVRP